MQYHIILCSIISFHTIFIILSGNRKRHMMNLAKLRESVCLGEASLQNSIEQAIQSLRSVVVDFYKPGYVTIFPAHSFVLETVIV